MTEERGAWRPWPFNKIDDLDLLLIITFITSRRSRLEDQIEKIVLA